jgi:hypothetical protein
MTTEKLKEILSGLDIQTLLEKILPDLAPILAHTHAIARVLMLIGPFLILAMGLRYLLNAPKEANYRAGYRCHFGMGSVEAWQFTQRLAGAVWSVLGLVLVVWMAIAGRLLVGLPTMDAMAKVAVWLLWQAGLLLLCRWVINFVAFLRYNHKGNRRRNPFRKV